MGSENNTKAKMKDLLNKLNNPFSSTPKFKGQSHVLGSANPDPTTSTSSSAAAAAAARRNPNPNPNPPPKPQDPNPNPNPQFTPFTPLISTPKSQTLAPLSAFDCPICSRPFPSEAAVSSHLDSCLSPAAPPSEVEAKVAEFASAGNAGAVEVVEKLLGNISREPGNKKFRRIRMGNPRIKEAVTDVSGGVELLECVGFRLGEDSGEVWATMEEPAEEGLAVIREAIRALERFKSGGGTAGKVPEAVGGNGEEPRKIDRQVRVFFSVPESEAAKVDLPDSFYNLSTVEIKREAEQRRKRLEESRLLIPKSYKEKQAIAAKRKYTRTAIRIQFPDGVVLQGVFLPWEPTKALYEFVATALKEPGLQFELLRPAAPKLRVIPYFSQPGGKAATLEEEDLVPSALLKFNPIETDSIVFTGLKNEFLEASEPLTSSAGLL